MIIYDSWYLLKKEHCYTYKINNYKIQEYFYKNDSHCYDFIIENKKENYTFTIKKNLKKQKQVIKDIRLYKYKDITCIVPLYKKGTTNNVYCNLNYQQVSNDYLIKNNKEDFSIIQKKIKKYKIIYPQVSTSKKQYKKLIVYNKNIANKDTFFIWDYKGIYLLKTNRNFYRKILDYDLYDNVMACVVDKYYVIFDNSSVKGIEKIYYYDTNKSKIKLYKPDTILSKDSYINGVVNNIIYVTDNKTKKEYIINIKKEKIEELDTKTTKYIIYNNLKSKYLTKSQFFTKKQIFKNNKEGHYTYFQKENKIYKRINNSKKDILLLELDDIKEWSLSKDEIIILKDNIIYAYNEEKGLRKIVENNELRYNYKNIYKLAKN